MITIQSLTIKQLNYEKGKDPVRYECGQMQLSFVCRWRQLPGDPSRHQAGRSRTELTESKISKELNLFDSPGLNDPSKERSDNETFTNICDVILEKAFKKSKEGDQHGLSACL